MPVYTKKKQFDIQLIPQGFFSATLCDVILLGMVQGGFGHFEAVRLVWLLGAINEKTGRPWTKSERYGLELTPKGKLTKALGSMRGYGLTEEEFSSYDLEADLGKSYSIQIVHEIKSNGNTYANIGAIMPLQQGHHPVDISHYTRHIYRLPEHSEDIRSGEEGGFHAPPGAHIQAPQGVRPMTPHPHAPQGTGYQGQKAPTPHVAPPQIHNTYQHTPQAHTHAAPQHLGQHSNNLYNNGTPQVQHPHAPPAPVQPNMFEQRNVQPPTPQAPPVPPAPPATPPQAPPQPPDNSFTPDDDLPY